MQSIPLHTRIWIHCLMEGKHKVWTSQESVALAVLWQAFPDEEIAREDSLFPDCTKNSLNIPLVQKPTCFYVENSYHLLPTMVTFEMASRPSSHSGHHPQLISTQCLSATYPLNFPSCTTWAAPSCRPKGSWYCNAHTLLCSKCKSCWHYHHFDHGWHCSPRLFLYPSSSHPSPHHPWYRSICLCFQFTLLYAPIPY